MPRGRHPRRLKRDGEVWHKRKGPHRQAKVYVLCFRCKRGYAANGWRRHVRVCFGLRRCFVCALPFPCPSRRCPWKFPKLPIIPPELVPYFRRTASGRIREEALHLEPAALRWYATLTIE